jgi:segregation and condensation protein B
MAEDAFEFLLSDPPLGLAVQPHGDELRLVTAPEVSSSLERHTNVEKPISLSKPALEMLAIVAHRQPIALTSLEMTRGPTSDSAAETLLGAA